MTTPTRHAEGGTVTSATATAPPLHDQTARVLALLAAGHTLQAAADRASWPEGAIRKLITLQPGWLIDMNGRVYHPGRPGYSVQLPDGVNPDLLTWARDLLKHGTEPAVQLCSPAPDDEQPTTWPPAPRELNVVMVRLDRIHGHPDNVREHVGDVTELASSIRAHGLLQPLTVRPIGADDYEIVAGHRRHTACQLAGLAEVPCVIRGTTEDVTVIELMIVENLHRKALNPIEKAEAFGRLRDEYGYTATQIGERTGLSQSTVSYFLALLELDTATRDKVRTGELAVGDALKLVRNRRAKERQKAGEKRDWTWEPDYLAKTHPLAKKARTLCEAREHTTRRRLGQIACGQCWETVIRADERVVIRAETSNAPSDSDSDSDHVTEGSQ